MQILYLIRHSLMKTLNRLYKKVLRSCPLFRLRDLGNFSLIIICCLGIFFGQSSFAAQTVKVDANANQTYLATFSFDTGQFAPRQNIKPDRVYFNSSGTLEPFSVVADYVSDFSSWPANYSTSSFETPQNSTSGAFALAIQAAQIQTHSTPGFFPAGHLALARLTYDGVKYSIDFATFASEADFVSSPNFGPVSVASNVSVKQPALMITKNRAYIFWINGSLEIRMRTHDGNALGSDNLVSGLSFNDSVGLGGCIVERAGNQYPTLAYARSLNEIGIAFFQDQSTPALLEAPTIINVNNISSSHIDLAQNPRDGHLYLAWIDGSTCYYLKSNTPGNPDFSGAPTAIAGNWKTNFALEIAAFNNFETGLVLSGTDNTIKNIALKSSDVLVESFATNGVGQIFPYTAADGKQYAGLLSLSGLTNYSFRKRLLDFPRDFTWQKSGKILHIEGPPLLNSIVSAEVDFAEVTSSLCLAHATNAAGGRASYVGNSNVIASAGNVISVVFDKNMNLNAGLVGNQVKLLAADNSAQSISFVSALSNELRFTTNNDLQLDSAYRVTVASDVLDANGSQIYQDNVLNFSTQKITSNVIASEVTGITIYSDAARTIAIAGNAEVNATTTLYLRIQAIDPAFNTIDTATATILHNGNPLADVTLTQSSLTSNNFDGTYNLRAPHGGNNLYEILSPNSAIKTSVRVDFPTLTSIAPNDGSTGVLINSNPTLVFSETIDGTTVNTSSIGLKRGGSPASYNLSAAGNTITIDPNDSSEGYLLSETLYEISAGYALRDLSGNPFISAPTPLTSEFTTQASQTPPLAVSSVKLFADAGYTTQLGSMADFSATGTVYIEMSGTDGSNLTKDYGIASLSTGVKIRLEETASATAIYRGSYSFAGLNDRFQFKAQSVTSPLSGASLLITYPRLTPISPASGAINVPVNSAIRVQADEAIQASEVNAANVKLFLGASAVATNLGYNPASREISISPAALLESEKTYRVEIINQKDISSNPQLQPLIFEFTCEDITPPTITSFSPSQNATNVTIDRKLQINFSESILPASANSSIVLLSRNGSAANYAVSVAGNVMTIDPNDSAENFLLTATSYKLEIGPSVTDLAGNGLSNVPATFTLNFSTQPANTPPSAIESLTLFKDPLLLSGWSSNEEVPASTTIYLKITGNDGATQTRDIATVTLDLSWAGNLKISLQETASNSSGIYLGSFNLDSIPLFGFPNPLPATSIGTLSFIVDQAPANQESLRPVFPALEAENTIVTTLDGLASAVGATRVRTDSSITTSFNSALQSPGDSATFKVLEGTNEIAGSRQLSADGKKIIFIPAADMPFASQITVSAIYAENGLKSQIGNPIFREFSFSFDTQNARTQPETITEVNLYSTSDYSSFSRYASLDDFPGTGALFIELKGNDKAPNTIDQTSAVLSNGDSVILNETTNSSGVFRGSYSYANLSDNLTLNVSSAITPTASKALLLSYPKLNQQVPASGAAGVSILTQIVLNSNETLDAVSIDSNNVKLLKNGTTEVPVTLSFSNSLNQLEISPSTSLDFSSQYFIRVSSTKDLVGNQQQNLFYSSFTTQPTAISPTVITGLQAFSDPTYSSQIVDNSTVAPQSQCYIQVNATDVSPGTIDSTIVRMSSDQTAANILITLVETGINTGVFRVSKELFAEENATITIASEVDPAFTTRIKTFNYPLITSIQPASGSTNLYLDTRFRIKGNKTFLPSSINKDSIILSDNQGIASYSPQLLNPDEIIIYTDLTASSGVFLQLNDKLADNDGLTFPINKAKFQTVSPVINNFRVYIDSAFTTQLSSGDNVEAQQTLYARIYRTDTYFYKSETAETIYSTPAATSTVLLNESSPGIFSGSFTVPDSPDQSLYVSPKDATGYAIRLNILPGFALLSQSPASGAVSVPADVWPTWNFSRPVNSTFANDTHFKLVKASNNIPVSGTISQSSTAKQVRFQPDSILDLLTDYQMSVAADVEDTAGNKLQTAFKTQFRTQPPPAPPTLISSFANYESGAYATSTTVVATDGTLFLQLVANDSSFSTYETARVRIDSSDPSIDGQEVVLVELAPPSGIFTLALPVNLPAGTSINIIPQVAPDKQILVTAHPRTRLLTVAPASGSSNLLLDTPLRLTFSLGIKANSVQNGIVVKPDGLSPVPFSASLSNNNRQLDIEPTTGYATGARHLLSLNSSLKDENGLFLLNSNVEFSTLAENSAGLELFTGLGERANQAVSVTGEATDSPIKIAASTTNLFSRLAEFRQLELTAGTQTFLLQLSELANQDGAFTATFTFPTGIAKTGLQATLKFFNNPAVKFDLASPPALLSSFPASGTVKTGEKPTIIATFSRLMAFTSAQNNVSIDCAGESIKALLQNSTDDLAFSWIPQTPLPVQASCTLNLAGLTDYLGQPLAQQKISFSTGGYQGINLYRDNAYSLQIATNQIEIPVTFAEVAASATTALGSRTFNLYVKTGRQATTTLKLPLVRAGPGSGKFRCSLEIEPGKSLPRYQLPMLPGEWLELTSPNLTDDKKVFYYRYSGAVSPISINNLGFYFDRHFATKLENVLPLPTLYIQADAEDLNWFTTDATRVKITTDSNAAGIVLTLKEAGTHSNFFRGAAFIDQYTTDQATRKIQVHPGQRIFVESLTDPGIRESILYLPENGLSNVSVFPSPVRGNTAHFRFFLNFPGEIALKIYDTAGHKVDSAIFIGREGENRYKWRLPRHVANGVYFYTIKLSDHSTAHAKGKRKMRGKFAVLR
jgi:hypothetical protein